MKDIIHSTLCFIFSGQGSCLMLKRTREPHKGQWNAPGGKVLAGETPEQGCRREVKEETGLEPKALQNMGYIDCLEAGINAPLWRLHLFTGRLDQVEVPDSPEGVFCWLDLADVLAGGPEIVHNIPLFLPPLLREIPVRGLFEYRDDFLERYNISLTSRCKGLPIG